MDQIIVSVQVPSLATAALPLIMGSSCIKVSMDKTIIAYGHTTLSTRDLVWSRRLSRVNSSSLAAIEFRVLTLLGRGKRGHHHFGSIRQTGALVVEQTWSITVVHQVAQINEAKINVRRSTAFLKMRRGELSGSAPLKEPGASKKRLKNGTPRLLDSACAAITSYQVSYRIQSLAA